MKRWILSLIPIRFRLDIPRRQRAILTDPGAMHAAVAGFRPAEDPRNPRLVMAIEPGEYIVSARHPQTNHAALAYLNKLNQPDEEQ